MLKLRKKIYEDHEAGKTEYKYCFIHEENYLTIDAAYCFNRCSHDNYYKNLQVTAVKIEHINQSATKQQVTESLKDVMNMMARSVRYPSVKTDEAEKIVDSVFGKTTIGSVHKFVHGEYAETKQFKENKTITKAISFRKTEWKYPQVKSLIEMSDEEYSIWEGIEDDVEAFIYKAEISRKKKTAYAQKARTHSKHFKLDSLIHSVRLELSEMEDVQLVTERMLFNYVNDIEEISWRRFIDSLNRLRDTGTVSDKDVISHNEKLALESTEKMLEAGYGIHEDKLVINKNRIHVRSKVNRRTVTKRWYTVEDVFNELNNSL